MEKIPFILVIAVVYVLVFFYLFLLNMQAYREQQIEWFITFLPQ